MKVFARLALLMAFMLCSISAQAEIIRDDKLYQDIGSGRLAVAKLQKSLKAGLDPNAMIYIPDTNNGMGLLELAVRAKNEPIAMTLLEAGADIDGYSEILGPLILLAIEQGLEQVTRFVLEKQPDDFSRIDLDSFPLAFAVDERNLSLVNLLLLEMAKDKNKYQQVLDESLIISIGKGPEYAPFSHVLIDAGARMEDKDFVLYAAISGISVEFVNEALKMGASPNSEFEGQTMLQIAIELASSRKKAGSVLIIWKLLEAGANQCFIDVDSNDLSENIKHVLLEFRSC